MDQFAKTLDSGDRRASARAAVSVGFYIFGLAWSLWAVHIPTVTHRLDIDPALLGLALLNVGLGAVISQPLTGWLVGRTSSSLVTKIFLPLTVLAPLLPITASSVPMVFFGAFVLGVIGGAANVAINTQATEVEAAIGKPVLSSFHGFFSLGGLSGALIGSLIISASLQDGRGAAMLILPLLIASLALVPFYLRVAPRRQSAAEGARRRKLALPAGAIVFLAVICFFTNTIEGAVGDWSALYLSTVRNLPLAVASSGFAVYSLAMAAFRFAGGPLISRLGERKIVLYGGVLIAVGMAIVVFAPWAALSPFGFALVAAGAANNYPVLMSAGSRATGGNAGNGVAAVATGGLLGFLVGPPAIGFFAHSMGLPAALASLILVGLIATGGAAAYRWPTPASGKA